MAQKIWPAEIVSQVIAVIVLLPLTVKNRVVSLDLSSPSHPRRTHLGALLWEWPLWKAGGYPQQASIYPPFDPRETTAYDDLGRSQHQVRDQVEIGATRRASISSWLALSRHPGVRRTRVWLADPPSPFGLTDGRRFVRSCRKIAEGWQ